MTAKTFSNLPTLRGLGLGVLLAAALGQAQPAFAQRTATVPLAAASGSEVSPTIVSAAADAASGSFRLTGLLPASAVDPLGHALLAHGEQAQVIQFNPGAALQKRIFADNFVPNSGEFTLSFAGTNYVAQRAEHLGTGGVRIYYAAVGDWANVRSVQRGASGSALGDALLAHGERAQVIQFNPAAALQKRIFADNFVPNSGEFTLNLNGTRYAAQRAEHLGSGRVRVYFAVMGDWGNVRAFERPAVVANTYTNTYHAYKVGIPAGWTLVENPPTAGGRPVSEYQMVTLQQPGYGAPGKFNRIFIYASQDVPPFVGLHCTSTYPVAGINACRASLPGGQNPPQEVVAFQRGNTYYLLQLVYEDASYVHVFNDVLSTFQLTQ